MDPVAGRLLVATRNRGKVDEIDALLDGASWRLEPLPAEIPDYEETGVTFAENARGKAIFYSSRTGLLALADDSGLEVDALGGEPGVRSARYIDAAMPQAQRNLEVLERLRGIPDADRSARFVCHLALALEREVLHETTGTCEGRIAAAPRGSGGFGYDPIFLIPRLDRTFAELSRDEKSSMSHRGKAVREMVEFLRGLGSGTG